MITTYILIMLYVGTPGSGSLTKAEFTSQAACEIAQKAVTSKFDGMLSNNFYSVCVRK